MFMSVDSIYLNVPEQLILQQDFSMIPFDSGMYLCLSSSLFVATSKLAYTTTTTTTTTISISTTTNIRQHKDPGPAQKQQNLKRPPPINSGNDPPCCSRSAQKPLKYLKIVKLKVLRIFIRYHVYGYNSSKVIYTTL